jgi:hypothetical protein
MSGFRQQNIRRLVSYSIDCLSSFEIYDTLCAWLENSMALLQAFLRWMPRLIIFGFVLFIGIWIFVFNWSFVFKKKIVGEVVAVQKVDGTLTVITNSQDPINPQAFSFSIAVRDLNSSEIHMASSEDRKWAAVQKGNCVVAAFFPYPPWNLKKGTTDHNARLLRNFQSCEGVNEATTFWENVKFFFLWQ